MATTTDYLKLHFIVFLWGFSAILGKLITVSSVELVLLRFVLAAVGMYLVISFMNENVKIKPMDVLKLILIGFIVSLHWLAFFGSARIANISVSLVGFATNSLWAALLEPWFNKTRIKKFELLLGLMVLLGLYIIFSFDFQYKAGLSLAILAGFTSALFSTLNSKMIKRVSSKTITFYEMCGGFLGTALFIFVCAIGWPDYWTPLELPSASDWIYLSLLAGVCSIYAYTVAIELLKKISVFLIQLTLNLEPLYGIIMAVIIFGEEEKMSVNFYVGTFIILCAVLSYPLLKSRFDRKIVLID